MTRELKIRLTNPSAVKEKLRTLGAAYDRDATYEYTYFNQPKGHVLKLTKKDRQTFKTVIETEGNRFVVKSSEKLADPQEKAKQLAEQYGVKKHLVNHRKFYTYEDYKLSINDIEGLGTFLILESQDPQLSFVTDVLDIQRPEVITDSFDNLPCPVYAVTIPTHKPDQIPDHDAIGQKLDDLLKQHFLGKKAVIRCIGSQDHPGLSLDELTNLVVKSGTDKYDPNRMGVGYEEFVKKNIKVDFYGEEVEITKDSKIMAQAIWEMHHSAIGDRGYGVHVDLVLVYDAKQLDMVMNLYSHHPTSDGFVFKDQNNKQAALLGVIKILSGDK